MNNIHISLDDLKKVSSALLNNSVDVNNLHVYRREDMVNEIKNLEAQIIADKITESYIKKYPFGQLK